MFSENLSTRETASDRCCLCHDRICTRLLSFIESELGENLYWYEGVTTETQGYVGLKECDVSDETDWADQHQWFATKFEKLVEVFRPRTERLM